MNLPKSQFLGNACRIYDDPNNTGAGAFCVSGIFSGRGVFSGCGLFDGMGLFRNTGYFAVSSGSVSGIVWGSTHVNPWDTPNGPLITVSGFASSVTGSNITYDYPSGAFYARNYFRATGGATGSFVTGSTSGVGWVDGSGCYYFSGYLAYASGTACGVGTVSGSGNFVIDNPPVVFDEHCIGCVSVPYPLFHLSGNFQATGHISGDGTYKIRGVSNSYQPSSFYFVSGRGLFTLVTGVFSGVSERPYYGFGTFTGQDITYENGSYSLAAQNFYGSGSFRGTGYLFSPSGVYSGIGTSKGIGQFYTNGHYSGLQGAMNRISGRGCWKGQGAVFYVSGGQIITGTLCSSYNPPDETGACGAFAPFITNCSIIGSLDYDFAYGGECI